jgi:UDP-N-acetyl-D-glucosamine dehydrogenase
MRDRDVAMMARADLRSDDATVGVIGLGYVGIPLAVALGEAGYRVMAVDINPDRVSAINRGDPGTPDVSPGSLASLLDRRRLIATTDFAALSTVQALSICVPTPLRKTGDPDISSIISAVESVRPHVQRGTCVVLESTTYPGTTSEAILPLLLEGRDDLIVGESLFLAFSPERVDPGREDWTIRTTPKVIGGMTPACLEVAMAYYGRAIETLVPVSSTEAAEMAKLLENTFRAVNIGLANEVMLMCDRLGLDVWEVIDAAATKPFGFMKFVPGPGLGGHCIPIDPLYLSWKLRTLNYHARFIELASEINTAMPRYWVGRLQDALNDAGKAVKGSRVLVLGVAYKRDIADIRESPALDIIHLLQEKGAEVVFHDPYVPVLDHEGMSLVCVPNLSQAVQQADAVLVATDHSIYEPRAIAEHAAILVDTRHMMHAAAHHARTEQAFAVASGV